MGLCHYDLAVSSMLMRACTLILLVTASSCDPPSHDGLKRELVEKSRHGLALGRITSQTEPSLEVRFFDGRLEDRHLECCPLVMGGMISRDRIVVVDPDLKVSTGGMALPMGGRVVVMDLEGRILTRSELQIISSTVSLAPDGRRFAFAGKPAVGFPYVKESSGVYVGEVLGTRTSKLLDVEPSNTSPGYDSRTAWSFDWSSDNTHLLFSGGGNVLMFDLRSAQSRNLTEGGGARWSPSGDRITYLTRSGGAAILDIATGESMPIVNGREILSPVSWSPGGDYLLILERHAPYLPCLASSRLEVYRISDKALFSIPCYGVSGPRVEWIQLAGSGT